MWGLVLLPLSSAQSTSPSSLYSTNVRPWPPLPIGCLPLLSVRSVARPSPPVALKNKNLFIQTIVDSQTKYCRVCLAESFDESDGIERVLDGEGESVSMLRPLIVNFLQVRRCKFVARKLEKKLSGSNHVTRLLLKLQQHGIFCACTIITLL